MAICWNIPSEWNAVADFAIEHGVVDATIDGARAPWRQASVLEMGEKRIAVVTVSNLQRSRAVFMGESYEVLGVFERTTTDPALVTDETRGYKPLTHIWPLVEQEKRILTLVTTAPLRSDPPTMGVFAYLAVGAHDTELLFVCSLRWAPGPRHGQLARIDPNASGVRDLALYPDGRLDAPPIATFRWDPTAREYSATLAEESKALISWWSTTPADRVVVASDRPIDAAIAAVVARMAPSSGP